MRFPCDFLKFCIGLGVGEGRAWKDLGVSRGQQDKYSFYKNQENLLL